MKYEDIIPYLEKKFISEQAHPEDSDVRIFNYTQKCQFEKAWDEVTMACRGLIMNIRTGKIIARPFRKFFNYGEHVSNGWAIPTSQPEIYAKMDGSLGILYKINGRPWIATRGSFTSDQAIWATNWWRENIAILPEENETNLFEIIYPANRIVVSYDFSGLVHLATIETSTGRTINRNWGGSVRIPARFDSRSIADLAALDEPNSEGFVVFYPQENVRMKIKLPEYVRLHKLVTGISEIAIWELLRDKNEAGIKELIEKVPDEFMEWVKSTANALLDRYSAILGQAKKDMIGMELTIADDATRKEQAEYIKGRRYPAIMFSLLDGKDPGLAVWRMVRPHGAKSFKDDIDA